ncbi:phage terminase small subunit [Terasakiella pusilla]|uniref:phage terminase small subunit n=1 Tax=Terasakiella pusilla TaxID=64973 RepID=UPI003AA94726
MSVMRRHMQKVFAEREAKLKAGSTKAKTPHADMMRAQLRDHENQLKQVQSVQAKVIKKRDFITAYEPYIEGILQADAGEQDDIVMTMMVWALDIGNFDLALRIASYALSHKLKMPQRFNRNVQTILVEEMADYAKNQGDDENVTDLEEYLFEAIILTEKQDMPDEARAKIYRELGALIADDKPKDTIDYWANALKLDPNCGVKTKYEKLRKAQEKAGVDPQPTADSQPKKPNARTTNTRQAQAAKTPPEET